MKKRALAYLFSGLLFTVIVTGLSTELSSLFPIPVASNAIGFVHADAAIFVCSLIAVVCFLTFGILAIKAITKEA